MNLQDIWSGTDYALFVDKGRNDNYRPYAPRIKAIRCYKRAEFGKERESGYAEVMMLEDDGTPRFNSDGTQIIKEVRARDVAMLWDAYEEERAYRKAQEDKRQRERLEREEEESRAQTRLLELLTERYGIPQGAITNITSSSIYLSRIALEKELGVVNNG